MKVGQTIYYKLRTSLGRVMCCAINKDELTDYDVTFKLTHTDEEYNYGLYRYYQLEALQNGQSQDFETANHYLVSNIIGLRVYSTNHCYSQTMTIKGIDESGKQFEMSINISGYTVSEDSILCLIHIIALMEFCPISELQSLAEFLFSSPDSYMVTQERIDAAKNIISKTIQQYPSLRYMFEKELEARTDQLEKKASK